MSTETGKRCPDCGQVQTIGAVRVKGVYTISYDGHDYQVPPLSLKGLRWAREKKIWKRIEDLQKEDNATLLHNDEWAELIAQLAHEALRRNYPDITMDQIEDLVDLGNVTPLLVAVRGISMQQAEQAMKHFQEQHGGSPAAANGDASGKNAVPAV